VAAAKAAGLRVAVNLVRVSESAPGQVRAAAATAQAIGADIVYLADSNGSMFPEAVSSLVRVVRSEVDVPLGFHAHDGLTLAFGNTLAALRSGVEHVDASAGGLGKGGGNLSLELLCGYLKHHHGRPVDIGPLLAAADRASTACGLDRGRIEWKWVASGLADVNIDHLDSLPDLT
jgi:4-hydroxy 2-oxovalerate aldolase